MLPATATRCIFGTQHFLGVKVEVSYAQCAADCDGEGFSRLSPQESFPARQFGLGPVIPFADQLQLTQANVACRSRE